MPKIGSCTDRTCDGKMKELYECHCCSRRVCLYHLNEHVEIIKQNKQRTESLRQELNTIVNTLQLSIDEKLSIIKSEQNLIEQAKKILDVSSSSIDELEDIVEKINQTITLNRSEIMVKVEPLLSETTYRCSVCKTNKENTNSNDVAEESEISKDESIHDEHVNEITKKGKKRSCIQISAKCPLTFDGAYGLTKANHSMKFCEHGKTRQILLYYHFMYTHELKKVYAQRLVRAVANHKDSRITKLFDENEDVINHFYKVSCPFFRKRVNSLKYNGQNVTIPSCRRRSITLYRLECHLRFTHKISKSLAQKLVNDFKKKSNKK
ncbi:unnamed protein product [Rotaria sordida]|uniref:Uncharacterized protein n=1 Tax=Rotaria sordida TaxID=392033 RepID=A0A815HYX1_9BILA|nr:unnamed protein product [Rotaria sordida]CAF1605611.1 unnamed protein product [Rotaria sordida]